jgi:hypothetical protein
MIRTYTELITLPTFEERFQYLKLNGRVGEETFGFDRYLNQTFYNSRGWKQLRNHIIVRDHGCDLGIEGREINGIILIHHMNPISVDDILKQSEFLMNPEYLISTIKNTHDAIHYGDENLLFKEPTVRSKYDTCPWRQI